MFESDYVYYRNYLELPPMHQVYLRLTCTEWRRFLVNLCSGVQDQTDARFSSETICFIQEKKQHWYLLQHPFVPYKDRSGLLPFEFVLFVPDVIGLVVVEEVGDPRGQVAVDAVHVAWRGHDGAHVFVAVLDALLHLNTQTHLAAESSHTLTHSHHIRVLPQVEMGCFHPQTSMQTYFQLLDRYATIVAC